MCVCSGFLAASEPILSHPAVCLGLESHGGSKPGSGHGSPVIWAQSVSQWFSGLEMGKCDRGRRSGGTGVRACVCVCV